MTDVKIREVSPQDAHEVWRLHDIAYNSTGHFFTMDHQEYNATPQSTKRWIRRVIISDTHIGTKFYKAEELLKFLSFNQEIMIQSEDLNLFSKAQQKIIKKVSLINLY